jgi:N-acetylglutamate synthase
VLGASDVGHRVVVRHVVGSRAGRPIMTDVLGELISYGETQLTVRTRRGEVTVPTQNVVAAKRVPPPPRRTRP